LIRSLADQPRRQLVWVAPRRPEFDPWPPVKLGGHIAHRPGIVSGFGDWSFERHIGSADEVLHAQGNCDPELRLRQAAEHGKWAEKVGKTG
jgi:hypothetical protein